VKRLLLAAALLVGASPAAFAANPQCPPPVELEADASSLPHLAMAMKPDGTADILAVGAGPAATPPGNPAPAAKEGGFAQFLAQDLEAGIHGLHVTITARGGRGLDATSQLDIIRAALKQHHYAAVLWQTGTLEAVRGGAVENFSQALSDGIDTVTGAGADLVLVEPQYSRFLEANADPSPYLSAMQAMDAAPGTLLFHRYELMHDWEDAGLIDLEHASAAERPAVAARLHACLAAELARALLAGAAAAGNTLR
jgi:hypothetical protein